MTGVVVNPTHAHGFLTFERVDGQWRARCMCGAFWARESKPDANRALNRHLSERAREFRKLRAELRKRQPSVPSESGDQYVMEVPQ